MKAAWYERNGSASDVLRFGERPTPEPGHGEVRVRLAYSAVNPSDVKSRAGSRPVRDPFIIPHSDGAGVIDKTGSGVDPTLIGQRVWTWNAQYGRACGTAAQYVTLPQKQTVTLPQAASLQQGACLGIPALTAYYAVELANLGEGQTVLIIGGASAVGFYAAQMARAKGARVICTVGSEARADVLRHAGFENIVMYKRESVAQAVLDMTEGKGVQAIIDMDFSTSAGLIEQGVLGSHGTFVCFGSNERGNTPVHFWTCLSRSLTLKFFLVYELSDDDRNRAIAGVNQLLDQRALVHQIGPCYPLDQIVQAHQAVESGQTLGKVLVDCT